MQTSLSTTKDDVLALSDDVATLMDASHAKGRYSPASPTPQFLAEEVEEARLTIAHLLRSTVCLAVNGGLVDKAGRAVEIMMAEH